MNSFLIVSLVSISLLILLLLLIAITFKRHNDEEGFVDENGLHEYYDRSLIEKKSFFRQNPNVSPDEIRSMRKLLRLFCFHKK